MNIDRLCNFYVKYSKRENICLKPLKVEMDSIQIRMDKSAGLKRVNYLHFQAVVEKLQLSDGASECFYLFETVEYNFGK